MNVYVKENSWLAKLAARKMKADKVAIVFGSTIHLNNTTVAEFLEDTEWVCHELKHVEQYKTHGKTGFIAKYLLEWMKKGYTNNKFEKEARATENDTSILTGVNFIYS